MRFPLFFLVAMLIDLLGARMNAGEQATAVATVTAGFVTAITVTSGGSNYISEPAITIAGSGGSGATAKAVLAEGQVTQIIILTAGTGYLSAPEVIIEPPSDGPTIELQLIPKLTIKGINSGAAIITYAYSIAGPWVIWTNVTVSGPETTLLDLQPDHSTKYYRVFKSTPGVLPGFKWIPPGSFLMGSPVSEEGRDEDETHHQVTITRGFWISDHEVTQSEYEEIMGSNPSNWRGTNRPVERVTYDQAASYCAKLTKRERTNGKITQQEEYRLPTEAEWEYATRAGAPGSRYGDLESIAWYDANSQNATKDVKTKQPNAWGLYDTIGNVWEWCLDWYGPYPAEPVIDPKGSDRELPGSSRVIRGGSIFFGPEVCRSAYRDWLVFSAPNDDVGFRPVLSLVR
jgi:formylglycine-generating enzyme required for sulfatase activity